MDITLTPQKLRGNVTVIPSKSLAHRLLICAALADVPTELVCRDTNRDIEATVDCLNALGAEIQRTDSGYTIIPIRDIPAKAVLNCWESGSTLRFMLPIVGAMGVDATFEMAGRLPQRPLSPLWEEMERMGCILSRPSANTLRCHGKLSHGNYSIDGSVSSQYITGLLFALSLIGDSRLEITGNIESAPYIELTRRAMALFQAPDYHSPGCISVEGDWSNGAFWLTAQFAGNPLTVDGLVSDSAQGDRAVLLHLQELSQHDAVISARDIPDLVPILAVYAAISNGGVFTDIRRLRLKESDRVKTTVAMITALGGKAEATEDTLTIHGTGLSGGTVDACNDHRIAMASAIAATCCTMPVTILGAQCVEKSYPTFWREYARLGGKYELCIR